MIHPGFVLPCRAMHDPDTRHEWVSVAQAAIHFGTSPSDIRRKIRRGELESESLPRPGGTLLRVRIPAPDTHQPIESTPAPAPSQDAPPETALLLDRLEAAHERERAQADRIAALAAEKAKAEADATHAQQAAKIERERRVEADKRAATFEQLAAERGRELERERQETARLRERRWWRWW